MNTLKMMPVLKMCISDARQRGEIMKDVTTFEGWYDNNPSWEFDMPVYMVFPIGMYTEAGNPGGVDELIEDYMINRHLKTKQKDYLQVCDPKEKRWIKSMFTRAKNGKARRGIFYWKRVIEWDPDDEEYPMKVIEEVEIGKYE